jgi:hypothetical protein
MSDGPDKKSLDQLSQRIAIAKKATEKPPKGQHHEADFSSDFYVARFCSWYQNYDADS